MGYGGDGYPPFIYLCPSQHPGSEHMGYTAMGWSLALGEVTAGEQPHFDATVRVVSRRLDGDLGKQPTEPRVTLPHERTTTDDLQP